MKLKTFDKTNTATATEYTVHYGNGMIETFTCDYLADNANETVTKKINLINMGAEVLHISAHLRKPGVLCVTVQI